MASDFTQNQFQGHVKQYGNYPSYAVYDPANEPTQDNFQGTANNGITFILDETAGGTTPVSNTDVIILTMW
jgi:hypothetical protein